MQQIKKAAFFLAAAFILTAALSISVSANGDVLFTDVRTFIDGHRIPNYRIGNNTSVILVKDLRNYGFDVSYDRQTRTTTVTRNPNKMFAPITNIAQGVPGDFFDRYSYTDIKAIINGRQVAEEEIYNIGGNIAVRLEVLRDVGCGRLIWNSVNRELRLTLNSAIVPPTEPPIQPQSDYIRIFAVPSVDRIGVGQTIYLYAVGANGAPIAATWSSSNSARAVIDRIELNNTGVDITGISVGNVTITATASGFTAVYSITVVNIINNINSISIVPSAVTLGAGDTRTLTANILPASANASVTWSSSNNNIAYFSNPNSGVIRGVRTGTVTVTATASNGLTATATVTVTTAVLVNSFNITPASATIGVNEYIYLEAINYQPSNATNRSVTWESSRPNIASVDSDGRVWGINSGTVTITATTSNGRTRQVQITVLQTNANQAVSISPSTATIEQGGFVTLTATVSVGNATNRTITWTSSNTDVATVDSSTGLVTGRSTGYAAITATVRQNNAVIATGTAGINVTSSSGNIYGQIIEQGKNFGPFTLASPIPDTMGGNMQAVQIDSFIFTNIEFLTSQYRLQMRVRGRSTESNLNFWVVFYNSSDTELHRINITRTVQINQVFDFTVTGYANTSPVDIINETARIGFESSSGMESSANNGQETGSGVSYWTGELMYRDYPTVPDFGTLSFAHFSIDGTAVMTVQGTRSIYTYNFLPHNFEDSDELNIAISTMYQNYIRELTRNGFWSVGVPSAEINIYQRDKVRVTVTRSGSTIVVILENV